MSLKKLEYLKQDGGCTGLKEAICSVSVHCTYNYIHIQLYTNDIAYCVLHFPTATLYVHRQSAYLIGRNRIVRETSI